MHLPGKRDCCWADTAVATSYATLKHSEKADVAVVGAGIVGLTAAYSLIRAGLSVTVLEARKIGRQVTGRSTAKVTAQHTLIYRYLIDKFGVGHSQLYADANRSGVEQIRSWVDKLGIDCDFEPKDAYVYTSNSSRREELEAEAEAARSLGFKADVLPKAPLPFDTVGALRFQDQAQFNPMQYLVGLGAAITAAGGRIFENTRVTKIDPDNGWRIEAGRNHLQAEHVIVATNFPIAGPISYDRTTRPRCHIGMAFRIASGATIDGMFIGIDKPTHSLRMGRDRNGPLLVVLGPSFQTGHDGDVAERFRDLEKWVRSNFQAGEAAWHWANEDYDTPDRVPFVGAPSQKKSPGLYVATGFNGWGISNGTAAGMLIADQIRERANPWTTLFDPTRRVRKDFNKGGDSQSLVKLRDIRLGEGGVIKLGKGLVAVRKAASGSLHALSALCTHEGCIVTWNNADQTWDCPCHGSIFSADGKVIHGPAIEPLGVKKLPTSWTKRRSAGTRRSTSKK
jgi:glycine/D-amino acid oxidase-like deaminating enzyme/nitrite reductase/ring-hydroxylating ferredoxin subunit